MKPMAKRPFWKLALAALCAIISDHALVAAVKLSGVPIQGDVREAMRLPTFTDELLAARRARGLEALAKRRERT